MSGIKYLQAAAETGGKSKATPGRCGGSLSLSKRGATAAAHWFLDQPTSTREPA